MGAAASVPAAPATGELQAALKYVSDLSPDTRTQLAALVAEYDPRTGALKSAAGAPGDAKPVAQPAVGALVLCTRGCCAFTAKLQIAMTFKGLPFETTVVPATDAPEWFVKAGGSIPTLMQRLPTGEIVPACPNAGDSSIVLGWLDEAYPATPSLVPADIAADVRAWATWAETECNPAVAKTMMSTAFPAQAEARAKLLECLMKLNEGLRKFNSNGGKYFFGDRITLVDCHLGPFQARIYQLEYFRDFVPPAELTASEAYRKGVPEWPQFAPFVWAPPTLRAELKGKIQLMPVISFMRLQHESMKVQAKQLHAALDHVSSAPSAVLFAQFAEKFELYALLLDLHSKMEDGALFVTLELASPGSTERARGDHEHEMEALYGILAKVRSVKALADGSAEFVSALGSLLDPVKAALDTHVAHFLAEEKDLSATVMAVPKDTQVELFVKALHIQGAGGAEAKWLPLVLATLPPPHAAQYVLNFSVAAKSANDPVVWSGLVDIVGAAIVAGSKSALSGDRIADLRERVPELDAALAAQAAV